MARDGDGTLRRRVRRQGGAGPRSRRVPAGGNAGEEWDGGAGDAVGEGGAAGVPSTSDVAAGQGSGGAIDLDLDHLVGAGAGHVCQLRTSDGEALCWGLNQHGQALPPRGVAFRSLTAGVQHTCGIRASDGIQICWGSRARSLEQT